MDEGDPRYLLERDKGPERAFVRDLVDSGRYLNTMVMPFALILLILLTIATRYPTVSNYPLAYLHGDNARIFCRGRHLGSQGSPTGQREVP